MKRRAGFYARVSTAEQTPQNQTRALRDAKKLGSTAGRPIDMVIRRGMFRS